METAGRKTEENVIEKNIDDMLHILKNEAENIDIETKMLDSAGDGQVGGGLLMLLPAKEDEDSETVVLTEVAAARLGEDAYYLQIYSVVLPEAPETGPSLLQTIRDINAGCPVGSFGLASEDGKTELYHRHSIVFTEHFDFSELALAALAALAAIALTIRTFFETLCEAAMPIE
jgi:hypothetical protein